MKKTKYLPTLLLCFCCTAAFAQKRISGHVWNKSDGPVIMANVVELDGSNRIVSATTTDVNGNFSMTIKNPNNRLKVSYIGYATQTMKIGTTTRFNVNMRSNTDIQEVKVTGQRTVRSNGMVIPKKEISVASQSLNMDEMAGLSFETAGEALQGQIAGLDIVANSGNLGSGTSMRLRGTSSINGSQEPLIVVDGYILEDYDDSDLDLTNLDDTEQFATLLQVNPEDIGEINVLKDAAATAIWGARGANGVLEIKTRRGSRGKTRVNFSYKFTGSWQPEGMDMLSGDEYTMMLKQAYFNPKQSDYAADIVELAYNRDRTAYYGNFNKNTDWIDEVTQFGQAHNYNVTLSGGGEKALFRISGSYDHETGTIIKQVLDRFTTSLALDYYVSDRIKFSTTFRMNYTKNVKNYGDILARAYQAMPNMAVYRNEYVPTADGVGYYRETDEYFKMFPTAADYGNVSDGYSSKYLSDMVSNGNPVAIANLSWEKESTYTINPQFSIEYKFLGKDASETQLDYTGEVYLNAFTKTNNNYYPGTLVSNSWYVDGGIDMAGNTEQKTFDFRTKHTLLFRPHFENEKHQLQVLGRFELDTNNSISQYLSQSGVVGGTDAFVDAYVRNMWTSTGKGHSMNYIGSLHYAYSSKYIVDLTIRADGSTRYGKGNKWGYFPGISGRWNMSDETFFQPLRKVISTFGIRGAWGVNGNTLSSEGLMYNNYSSIGNYGSNNILWGAIAPDNLRLEMIRWEKSKSWNVGVNLNFLEEMLQFDFNVYDKKTTDLLMQNRKIPSSTGFSSLSWANVGEMENKGWELFFNTNDICKIGKFSMVVRANVAQNINRINEMDPTVLASMNAEFNYTNENYLSRVQIGNALGGIYGFRYKGVYRFDYDHSGYGKNTDYTNTAAAAEASGDNYTCPVARDANGNIIYDANGNPRHMIFNYGGVNYEFQGGDAIYEDINHDGQINELDIVYLGSSNPKISGGFGFDFKYGRWTLKTNFNFRIGNKIVNMALMKAEDMMYNRNQATSVNARWRKNGDRTDMPRALNSAAADGNVYNALASDRYVSSGDYLRFQYLQLSYRVPEKFLKKYGLRQLNISASGNNLIFWSKYSGTDPDHSQSGYGPTIDDAQTPRSRSFTVSLNVGF